MQDPYEKKSSSYAIFFVAAIMLGLLVAIGLSTGEIKPAKAGERDYSRTISNMARDIRSLQNRVNDLEHHIEVLKLTKTVRKEWQKALDAYVKQQKEER